MKDHGRKSNWSAQLSPYLRGLKIKNLIQSPKSPRSPKSPKSPNAPESPRSPISPRTPVSPRSAARLPRRLPDADLTFQIVHTPDRPERPISRRAIPSDEQCMQFLMALQRQEENKRGHRVKTGLQMWPYPEEGPEDRRYLRSVRVESVHLEEARLARTNSSGPARVVEVGRSSTKSTLATRSSLLKPSSSISDVGSISEVDDLSGFNDISDIEDEEEHVDVPRVTVLMAPLSPRPTSPRCQSRLGQWTPKGQMSRWSADSESLFSSRDTPSPCPQRWSIRSSAEASSPTMVGDNSTGPSTPCFVTPVKNRPSTPFTDPRLRSLSDPTTPPPSDHIVHQMSPESPPRNYSWRSSKETVLNTSTPVSKFHSWLPESRSRELQQQQHQKSPQPPQQQPEAEVYGEWADYYFEDGNFWEEDASDDGRCPDVESGQVDVFRDSKDETRGETKPGTQETDEGITSDDEDDEEEVEDEEKKRLLGVDDAKVYPRYESFIKDYKLNVMNVTILEV
ncbi:hypothetical protein Cob_v000617 [Colletotrichum orbiculare MAFF 240422]|uniref:Uncharacterized protein n=1 Tax=Colletotrichum orbiculare (strain 104-T / ATCC 96160 / CBS 514.97 / LARS 414 / MAFF 240422) TaxID=1213857 RepID=N4W4B5_COLOR|nr:hypothetical protein Cob_v000617 [Colletotrichum orbiculare MAFF 240422]